jgi:hypothetical protein
MPFQSKAQARACFAKNDPDWNCEEWADKTNFKKLPEKKKANAADCVKAATSTVVSFLQQAQQRCGQGASSQILATGVGENIKAEKAAAEPGVVARPPRLNSAGEWVPDPAAPYENQKIKAWLSAFGLDNVPVDNFRPKPSRWDRTGAEIPDPWAESPLSPAGPKVPPTTQAAPTSASGPPQIALPKSSFPLIPLEGYGPMAPLEGYGPYLDLSKPGWQGATALEPPSTPPAALPAKPKSQSPALSGMQPSVDLQHPTASPMGSSAFTMRSGPFGAGSTPQPQLAPPKIDMAKPQRADTSRPMFQLPEPVVTPSVRPANAPPPVRQETRMSRRLPLPETELVSGPVTHGDVNIQPLTRRPGYAGLLRPPTTEVPQPDFGMPPPGTSPVAMPEPQPTVFTPRAVPRATKPDAAPVSSGSLPRRPPVSLPAQMPEQAPIEATPVAPTDPAEIAALRQRARMAGNVANMTGQDRQAFAALTGRAVPGSTPGKPSSSLISVGTSPDFKARQSAMQGRMAANRQQRLAANSSRGSMKMSADMQQVDSKQAGCGGGKKKKKMSKKAAIHAMTVYLDYLGRKRPLGEKMSGTCRINELASVLRDTGDLTSALAQAYPEKTAQDRTKLAKQLVKGLASKLHGAGR